jgi:hypothetical protein
MKKLFTVLLTCCALYSNAQDTTALRWVGVNENGELNFFGTDTTDFVNYPTGYGTGQAIFMNNSDSLVYGIFDDSTGNDRNLYKINPFTGAKTLVWDLPLDYISSADISADGSKLYVIQGNGGSAAIGVVSSIDMATGIATLVDTVLSGAVHTTSYGMEYNPLNNSLYIFEGSWDSDTLDRVQVLNLTTNTLTDTVMIGGGEQFHGALWTGSGNTFIVAAGYGCDMFMTDNNANNLVSFYETCPYNTADVELFRTLRAKNTSICPNTTDSAMISLIYPGTSFSWYKNGVQLPETNDTLITAAAGIYRALIEIDTTGKYMWSEPVTVTVNAVPVVNISQSAGDTLICPGETITLTGASGGTLKWYRNSVLIPGATSSTYAATLSGNYNQTKTNTSGCTASAALPYHIADQLTGCSVGIEESASAGVNMYPNPVESILTIEATEMIHTITIFDMVGKQVYRSENVKQQVVNLDLGGLAKGSYVIKIGTNSSEIIRRIQK